MVVTNCSDRRDTGPVDARIGGGAATSPSGVVLRLIKR